MTAKEYNTIHLPKVDHAVGFVNCLEHAVQKGGSEEETMRQLAIIGWSEECKETILRALEEYKANLRKEVVINSVQEENASKDKHVEEIARTICVARGCHNYKECSECPCDGCCMFQEMACQLKDYRKEDELAKEIFDEIDRACIDLFGNFNHKAFIEIKKKYIKE